MVSKLVFDIINASDNSIDTFAKEFIDQNSHTINSLCYSIYKDVSEVPKLAFREIALGEIKKALYSFANNNNDPKYIEEYLFACLHKTIKSMKNESKHNVYICPACKYFSKLEILESTTKKLICNICKNSLIFSKNKWEEKLYSTFSEHNRKGFACSDCERFIPDQCSDQVSCPYPNCFFVGNVSELKIVRHPFIKANMEIPILTEAYSDNRSTDTAAIVLDDITRYMVVLNECIETQIKQLHYKGNNSTYINKLCMYDAFKNIIEKNPSEMVSYLVLLNRNVKIQHKIFQEFVKILETKIPFSFKRRDKFFDVKSLLDPNLCVFDGISDFNAIVDEKNEIQNNTEELFVGSRDGSFCRPYYIGRVEKVVDIDTGNDITGDIKEYTFFKVVMKENIKSETKVVVSHMRIVPSYSMNGLANLNKIRREIVDRVYQTLHGEKRSIKITGGI
jgi:hypothetical protein